MIEIAILFIVLGILIKYFKMYFLIAGYNTMSKEEKAKYDIDGLASVFRNAMFGMALINIAGHYSSIWFENPEIASYSMYGAILIGLPYLLLKSNADKFKIKDK
ncbi:MAG: DUF3784 domain-containing protein [Cyanobacteria bacterium P01_A01_bin.37]